MYEIAACTTFSRRGWGVYGKRFVESFRKHWKIPLCVFHESQGDLPWMEGVEWIDLDKDSERVRFLAENGSDPSKLGSPSNPNGQGIRFSHKVFAMTSPLRPKAAWWVWIDADVVFHADVTPDWVGRVFPEGKDLVSLDREIPTCRDRPAFPETGFVGFRTEKPEVNAMLADMRAAFVSGEVWRWPPHHQHDAAAYKLCRHRSGVSSERWLNLNPDRKPYAGLSLREALHPWERSPLQEVMSHQKGPSRKQQTYGSAC